MHFLISRVTTKRILKEELLLSEWWGKWGITIENTWSKIKKEEKDNEEQVGLIESKLQNDEFKHKIICNVIVNRTNAPIKKQKLSD